MLVSGPCGSNIGTPENEPQALNTLSFYPLVKMGDSLGVSIDLHIHMKNIIIQFELTQKPCSSSKFTNDENKKVTNWMETV